MDYPTQGDTLSGGHESGERGIVGRNDQIGVGKEL